jgi:hypothetical protein
MFRRNISPFLISTLPIEEHSVGFEVLTPVVMKSTVFFDTTPLKGSRRFGGTCRLHIPPKRQLTFSGLHDVISRKKILCNRKFVGNIYMLLINTNTFYDVTDICGTCETN